MSHFLRAFLSLALLASAAHAGLGARAQTTTTTADAPTKQEELPADSAIYGRAVYEETGRPVRRARMRLMGLDASGANYQRTRSALTNANGEFRISGVHAGSYLIYVEGPGLLSPYSFTGTDGMPGVDGLDVILTYFERVKVDGKADKEVAVRARLGASVAGRVAYENGDPVPAASVTILRRSGGRTLKIGLSGGLSSSQTDERGRFRFSGLPPGEYLVYASELMAHGGQADDKIAPSPVVVTYHPSSPKPEGATAVKAAVGEEVEGVDITIAERRTHTLSGIVRGRHDGRPLAGARVEFSSRETGDGYSTTYSRYAYGPNVVSADEQGRWRFEEIPDGEYSLQVTPPLDEEDAVPDDEDEHVDGEPEPEARKAARPSAAPKKGYAPARRTVTVAGNDVSDIVLTLGEAGRITGSFAVEGGGKLPENLYVMASQTGGPGDYPATFTGGMEGREFVIDGLPPGKYMLHATLFDLAGDGDLYVKSVTWRGRNLLREQIDLKEGESAEGVTVLFAPGRATARLRVYAGADKTPARGVHVAFLPLDPAQRYRADLPYCYTDADGACSITGPPGEYAVVTYRLPEEGEGVYDGTGAEALKANAPRVTLRAGTPGVLEVTVPRRD